ncbi:MAG: hypothetical protein JWP91_2475 [Fibrobacteres bacterium]|nr:hypothetical protein [Fibrobacterota bacterium]
MVRLIPRLRKRFAARRSGAIGLLSLAAITALVLAAACDPGAGPKGDGPVGCADLSSRNFGDSTGDGHYRVVSPNGGETFKVGDSLRILFTSGAQDSEAVVYLSITRNGSTSSVAVPGSPSSNIDPRTRCSMTFLVPDSIRAASGRKIPMASDSVRIRIAKYNFETISDYSDGFFRILGASDP